MKALLIKKKVGDFTEAYRSFYPLIFSLVHSRIGSEDDACDICQEVFARLYEKFDTVENPRKWLYGAMRNVVLEYYRKSGNIGLNIDENLDDLSLAYVNGFRDTRIMIKDAMDNMSNFNDEKEKAMFDLIAVHRFSFAETGRHLGMSRRTVKYRYGLIVRRLTDYFAARGISRLEDLL